MQGYDIVGDVPDDVLQRARTSLEEWMAPLPPGETLMLLGQLRVLVKVPKGQPADDVKLQATAYAQRLSEYPAEVVRYVLKTQPNLDRFWPSWSELHERLELATKKNRMVLEAIKRGPIQPPSTKPSINAPTADYVEKRVSEVLENSEGPPRAASAGSVAGRAYKQRMASLDDRDPVLVGPEDELHE